ncbi:MAG: RNA polymerase subunit sigma [Ignavibacteria bacterium]
MSNDIFLTEAIPHLEALRTFAFTLCRDRHHTEDLVQETMLKAYRAFHTYREGTNCRAWLFQICKNSYINNYRRRQYEVVPCDLTGDASNTDADQRAPHPLLQDDTAQQAHEATVSDEVVAALDALPPDYQTALILCDIEGYSYEEIAQFSSTPIGTIRSRIHRARKLLATRLERYASEHGYDPSLFTCTQ